MLSGSVYYQVDTYITWHCIPVSGPHSCHPHHVADTWPANASHQNCGVDIVTAMLAAQVTMTPCRHTIIWDEKRSQNGNSVQWWSENACWHVSNPCSSLHIDKLVELFEFPWPFQSWVQKTAAISSLPAQTAHRHNYNRKTWDSLPVWYTSNSLRIKNKKQKKEKKP